MAILPDSGNLVTAAQNTLTSGWQKLQGLFGYTDFSPEQSLSHAPGIDSRLVPRVAMSSANIDVGLLSDLSHIGLRHSKEVTAQTHPELYQAWAEMSARAGLAQPPQLIIGESPTLNALTVASKEVVMTSGLLKMLNLREVRAVLGHELAHEISDHTKPRVLAMAAFGVPGALIGNEFAHRGGIGSLVDHTKIEPGKAETSGFRKFMKTVFGTKEKNASSLASVAYITAGATVGGVIANQIAVRRTELDADRKAVEISGDAEGLISALQKLEAGRGEKTMMQHLRQIQSGYPSIEKRISHLREIAKTLPPVAAPPPSISPTSAPKPQIRDIAQAERVGTPVQTPIASL